ncbi:MAG: pantoate--beta-alanine ligase [Muribaculaceae bacterium]|nr:pantoate--beta-alanine ligase [Muribaculaceae bacterium]
MEIIRTVSNLISRVNSARQSGKTIGLVPTMGALHDGHLSLVNRARNENDILIVSVFVNPTQFNNPSDLETYPRTEEADVAMLRNANVDIAFIPSVSEIYPEPDTRIFDLGPVADVMEGKMRPGHFNGVAQIVSKLFRMTQPNRAYFGEKDFQQIAVIRKLVELENFDIDIVDCPICRDSNGLALSSRNARLSPEKIAIAPQIYKTLLQAVTKSYSETVASVVQFVTQTLNQVQHLDVEYFTIVDSATLQPISEWPKEGNPQAIGCIAVFCGDVRLIDNIKFPLK